MPGARYRYYPPRSWSTYVVIGTLIVLLIVLTVVLFSRLGWLG